MTSPTSGYTGQQHKYSCNTTLFEQKYNAWEQTKTHSSSRTTTHSNLATAEETEAEEEEDLNHELEEHSTEE